MRVISFSKTIVLLNGMRVARYLSGRVDVDKAMHSLRPKFEFIMFSLI